MILEKKKERSLLMRAMARLDAGALTCVITDGVRTFESRERGVSPLLAFLRSGEIPPDCVAADRVVGKAAAFLYVLLRVRAVQAHVMSRPACEVFERYGIEWSADQVVEAIRNRAGTGFCPMESAVRDVTDAALVPDILYAVLEQFKK